MELSERISEGEYSSTFRFDGKPKKYWAGHQNEILGEHPNPTVTPPIYFEAKSS